MFCSRWVCRAERAASAIRFSLGKQTTAEEIAETVAAIERICARLNARAATQPALAT